MSAEQQEIGPFPEEHTEQIAKGAPAETPVIAPESPQLHVQPLQSAAPKPQPNQQGKGPKPRAEYTGPSQADVQKMREAFQKQSDRMANLEKAVERLEKSVTKLADSIPAAMKAHHDVLQTIAGLGEWERMQENDRQEREKATADRLETLISSIASAHDAFSALMNRLGMTALGRQTKAELLKEHRARTRPDAPWWARMSAVQVVGYVALMAGAFAAAYVCLS